MLVPLASHELDALLNVADERDTFAGNLHRTLVVSTPLNTLFDLVLGVVV